MYEEFVVDIIAICSQVAEDKKGQIFDLDKIKSVNDDIENRLIDEKIIDEFSIEE